MNLPLPKESIRYVTDTEGKTTGVLVEIDLWQQLVKLVSPDQVSGLAGIDEYEPRAELIKDLQESLQQAIAGKSFSLSQLWEDAEL